jgi:hypothetical protein
MVSEKDIKDEVITFWSRIEADSRQQHAQKEGGGVSQLQHQLKSYRMQGGKIKEVHIPY